MLLVLGSASSGAAQERARQDPKGAGAAKGGAPAPAAKSQPSPGASAAAFLESAYQGERPPEAARMLAAILRGSQMGPGEGWFGPAQSRYSWKWLAQRSGVDPATKTGISRGQFRGSDALFVRLDRDRDGVITPADLDWSDRNPYVQMSNMANRVFRRLNTQGNGRLTKDELVKFFASAAEGKEFLSPDDFRNALLSGWSAGSKPSDMPTPAVLIRGLFAGEIGSMNEGPILNTHAPDFTLTTVDGTRTIQLAKLIGPKPIVLVFGSFT
jgi:hypothetical protein